jgi:hypothetical protein
VNRELGNVEQIEKYGQITVRMDNDKVVTFDPNHVDGSVLPVCFFVSVTTALSSVMGSLVLKRRQCPS